jgi:4-amino-4-deoxy-L-arabinose transferase-like glycosyltransferase
MPDSQKLRSPQSTLTPNRLRIAVFALIVIATVRIVLTYPVFSLTSDEPAHVTCGLEWLEKGTYTYEAQHPPLARVMTALLPYVAGTRLVGGRDMYQEGWDILNSGGQSGDRNLMLARLGILPFLWLGVWVIFRVTVRFFDAPTALLSTAFFTLLPPVLAHGGLATTDMALTAMLGLACYALFLWVGKPSLKNSIGLGVALALAVLSKLSSLAFLPAIVFFMAATHLAVARPGLRGFGLRGLWVRFRQHLVPAAVVAGVALVVIWAGYRFSFHKYPAPELFAGIQEVREHNAQGHPSYLLGARSHSGFWYYYPVVLAVKTPLALLLLFFVGVAICWKRRKEFGGRNLQPLAFAAAMLAIGAASRINIGVRHVLPIYYAIAIVAAIAARALWNSNRRVVRMIPALLILWIIASSVLSHPDYLAYFNELAARAPEKVIVDSDLDWGQDWKRLSQRLKAVGATEVAVDPILVKNPHVLHDFPKLTPLDPDTPKPGWNVVSLSLLTLRTGMFFESPREHPWAERIPPTERIGKTLLVWYVPEPSGSRTAAVR